ncbi:hypothetical protein MPER_14811, partial [Moniliophthora perniciosa FA553]
VHQVGEFACDTFEGRRKPDYFFFDSNCILRKHANNDTRLKDFFANVGMPVDVFHFKSKHKASDKFCGENCNPWGFSDLWRKDEKGNVHWVFNSSVAEETNSWF